MTRWTFSHIASKRLIKSGIVLCLTVKSSPEMTMKIDLYVDRWHRRFHVSSYRHYPQKTRVDVVLVPRPAATAAAASHHQVLAADHLAVCASVLGLLTLTYRRHSAATLLQNLCDLVDLFQCRLSLRCLLEIHIRLSAKCSGCSRTRYGISEWFRRKDHDATGNKWNPPVRLHYGDSDDACIRRRRQFVRSNIHQTTVVGSVSCNHRRDQSVGHCWISWCAAERRLSSDCDERVIWTACVRQSSLDFADHRAMWLSSLRNSTVLHTPESLQFYC